MGAISVSEMFGFTRERRLWTDKVVHINNVEKIIINAVLSFCFFYNNYVQERGSIHSSHMLQKLDS